MLEDVGKVQPQRAIGWSFPLAALVEQPPLQDADALGGLLHQRHRLHDLGDDTVARLQVAEFRLFEERLLLADLGDVAEAQVIESPEQADVPVATVAEVLDAAVLAHDSRAADGHGVGTAAEAARNVRRHQAWQQRTEASEADTAPSCSHQGEVLCQVGAVAQGERNQVVLRAVEPGVARDGRRPAPVVERPQQQLWIEAQQTSQLRHGETQVLQHGGPLLAATRHLDLGPGLFRQGSVPEPHEVLEQRVEALGFAQQALLVRSGQVEQDLLDAGQAADTALDGEVGVGDGEQGVVGDAPLGGPRRVEDAGRDARGEQRLVEADADGWPAADEQGIAVDVDDAAVGVLDLAFVVEVGAAEDAAGQPEDLGSLVRRQRLLDDRPRLGDVEVCQLSQPQGVEQAEADGIFRTAGGGCFRRCRCGRWLGRGAEGAEANDHGAPRRGDPARLQASSCHRRTSCSPLSRP